jgi:TorA maturation chaperone TorD
MAADGTAAPPPLAPEDQARADLYALLALLYADAPDAALLRAIAAAPSLRPDTAAASAADAEGEATGIDAPESSLAAAWDALRTASALADATALGDEYTALFVGVGKSEVNLHGSHWIAGHMMDKPLVAVRATLVGLGLAQRPGATMLEDHLSALCETMRMLVAGAPGRPPAPLPVQRAFCEDHLFSWVFVCCCAIRGFPVANYYARVAQFPERFLAIERDSFAID